MRTAFRVEDVVGEWLYDFGIAIVVLDSDLNHAVFNLALDIEDLVAQNIFANVEVFYI